jgi:microcystin synthetase protein McyA
LQLVHQRPFFPIPIDDLRHPSHSEQEKAIDEFVAREKVTRFDISRPPLIRFHIHLRGDDSFQFTLTEHHSIIDGWSLTSVVHEVFDYHYARLNNGAFPDEPSLSVTFRDYVRLERLALESEECQKFWAEKLKDCTMTKLPRWHSSVRPAAGSRVRRIEVPISSETSDILKQFARSIAVPLKSVCLAVHIKVLSLITDETDILTGVPIHGRPEEVDGVAVRGLFLNTLPFRIKLSECSWKELVQQVFATERELMPYRRYPLAAMHKNWAENPLFETFFSLVHFHHLESMFGEKNNLRIQSGVKRIDSTHYALLSAYNMFPPNFDLRLHLQYDINQLCEEQVIAYVACYAKAISAIAQNPLNSHTDLNAASMLSESDSIFLGTPVDVAEFERDFSF